MFLFRKATRHDFPKVYALKQAVIQTPYSGMNWNDTYPSDKVLKNDIETESMFLLQTEDGQLLGAVSINDTYDIHYQSVNWQTPNPALYMHRLFIAPDHRGQHLGEILIGFVEKEALNRKYRSIRFDSCTSNYPAHRLYSRCGYIRCGQIPLTGKNGLFLTFEKIL